MTRIPTIAEVLKEHNGAYFTLYRSNGDEIFRCPLKAAQVHEGLDRHYLGCTVSETKIEYINGIKFVDVTLRW